MSYDFVESLVERLKKETVFRYGFPELCQARLVEHKEEV